MERIEVVRKDRGIFLITIVTYIALSCLSIILKKDLVFYFNLLLLGIIVTIIIFPKDDIIIFAVLICSIILKGIIDKVGILPSMLSYLPDYFILIIFLKVLYNISKRKTKVKNKLFIFIFTLLCINIISLALNRYSISVFAWGIRNNFRFFVFYIACIYLDLSDIRIKKMLKVLIIIAIAQFPITLIQYKISGNFDLVSGTFGNYGTGYMLEYLIIILSLVLALYFYKKLYFKQTVFCIIVITIPLIIGEVRAVFLLVPILIMTLILSRKKTPRGATIILITIAISGTLFYSIYNNIYKDSFSTSQDFHGNFFSRDFLEFYLYDMSYVDGSLNRVSAPIYINNIVLSDPARKLFGIGLGNGAPNKYQAFQGEFNKNNSSLKYEWFFASYFLLENGYLGLFIYLSMFIYIYRQANYLERNSSLIYHKIVALALKGGIVVTLCTLIYNNGILSDQYGFVFWFFAGVVGRFYNNITQSRDINELI